jgi:hypothetical protein
MRPHWAIDTFTSLEDVLRWVDPWLERVWEEPFKIRRIASLSSLPYREARRINA